MKRNLVLASLFSISVVLVHPIAASEVELVRDINQTPLQVGSDPDDWVVHGGFAYFAVDDGVHGEELWRTDGTEGGTFLLADACPGSCDSGVILETHEPVGEFFFFRNRTSDFGYELWRTDGSPDGTTMVRDICPGRCSTRIEGITGFLGRVFFTAKSEDSDGEELWSSDGTDEGTAQVADLGPDHPRRPPSMILGEFREELFFIGDRGNGHGIWKTDGTPAGTVVVKDIADGDSNLTPGPWIHSYGVGFLFSAWTRDAGTEIWRSDGTAAGTYMLRDICPGPCSGERHPWHDNVAVTEDGIAVFPAEESGHGRELWRTDGTTNGTYLVRDILPGSFGSLDNQIHKPLSVGGRVIVWADDGEHGFEPWITDGSFAGTSLVANITNSNLSHSPYPFSVVSWNDVLFFRVDDGEHGEELWRTDGTEAGTHIVADIAEGTSGSNPSRIVPTENGLLFAAERPGFGQEPWRSDGTSAGTEMLADVFPGSGWSSPKHLADLGDQIVFFANDGVHGSELISFDGDSAELVVDINSHNGGSVLLSMWADAGHLLFSASDGVHGLELWRSDGSEGGTEMVYNIGPGDADGMYSGYRGSGLVTGRVVLPGDDGEHGFEPWIVDLRSASAGLLDDIRLEGSSDPQFFNNLNGFTCFVALDETLDWCLVCSDGTTAGTQIVADLDSNPSLNLRSQLILFHDRIYFSAVDGTHGSEIWRTDGRFASMFIDLHPGEQSSEPRSFTAVGDSLYFLANDEVEQYSWDLWCLKDGIPELVLDGAMTSQPWSDPIIFGAKGRLMVFRTPSEGLFVLEGNTPNLTEVNLEIGRPSLDYREHVRFGDETCFLEASSNDLWCTDGSAGGTWLVMAMADPKSLAATTESLFFTRDNRNQLWRTDGIELELVSTGIPDAISKLTPYGDTVYFSGDDTLLGRELWRVRDRWPPRIKEIRAAERALTNGQQTHAVINDFTVRFTEMVKADEVERGMMLLNAQGVDTSEISSCEAATANPGNQVQIAAYYDPLLWQLRVVPEDGPLGPGRYLLLACALIVVDMSGNQLDGDVDGVGGDDLVFDFEVVSGARSPSGRLSP